MSEIIANSCLFRDKITLCLLAGGKKIGFDPRDKTGKEGVGEKVSLQFCL